MWPKHELQRSEKQITRHRAGEQGVDQDTKRYPAKHRFLKEESRYIWRISWSESARVKRTRNCPAAWPRASQTSGAGGAPRGPIVRATGHEI